MFQHGLFFPFLRGGSHFITKCPEINIYTFVRMPDGDDPPALTSESRVLTLPVESLSSIGDEIHHCLSRHRMNVIDTISRGYIIAPRVMDQYEGRYHFTIHTPLQVSIGLAKDTSAVISLPEVSKKETARQNSSIRYISSW